MDRSFRQKINKETLAIKDTLGLVNLIDIYSTFQPKARYYTFFLCAHATLSRIDLI